MYRLNIAAFVEDDHTREVLEKVMGDITMFRSTMEFLDGGIPGATEHYGERPTPDLVFLQSTGNQDEITAALDAFGATVGADTKIVVLGTVDKIEFYVQLKEAGFAGYLLTPVDVPRVLKAIQDIYGAEKVTERGRVIAVFGSKGGVGASTVAHNLTFSLARIYGRPVTLVDLDIHFGTSAIAYNHEPINGVTDALKQSINLDDGLMDRLLSKEGENVWILPAVPYLGDGSILTPESAQAVIDQAGSMSSFVVVDLPHSWDGAVGSVMLACDELVIVTEGDIVGLRNASMIVKAFTGTKPKNTFIRAVLNNVGLDKATEVGEKDRVETLESVPVAVIPWDPSTFRSSSCNGQMIGAMKGKAKLVAQFDALARRVSAGVEKEAADRMPTKGAPGTKVKAKSGRFARLFERKAK